MSLFDLSPYQQARIDAISKSFNQEVATDLLEKGKVSQPIGTIKEMGGRNYIKTNTGWKYHGKGTGAKAQEHVKGSLQHHVSTASQKHIDAMNEGATEVEADQIARGKRNVGDHSGQNTKDVSGKTVREVRTLLFNLAQGGDDDLKIKLEVEGKGGKYKTNMFDLRRNLFAENKQDVDANIKSITILNEGEETSKDQILSSYRSELKEALKKDKGDEEGKNVTAVLDKYMNMPGEHDSDHLNEIMDEEIDQFEAIRSINDNSLKKLKEQLTGIDPKSEEAQNIIQGFASKYQGDLSDINAVLTNLSVTSPPKKGAIVGKTRSGKDIVEGQDPSKGDKFPGWSQQDHADAVEAHMKVAGAAKKLGDIYYKQNEKKRAINHYSIHDSHMKSVKGHELAITNWKFK